MDWTSFLADRGARLRPGCTSAAIEQASRTLGVTIPTPLGGLLMRTNGFSREVPGELAEHLNPDEEWYEPCWGIEELTIRNLDARTQDRIPTCLLAFGDDGSDEWFCLDSRTGADDAVYSWSAIAQEDTRIAPDLPTFRNGWLTNGT